VCVPNCLLSLPRRNGNADAAAGRQEGDGFLGDQSADVNCCGNHLDYLAGLGAGLFEEGGREGKREGILYRAVGKEVGSTHLLQTPGQVSEDRTRQGLPDCLSVVIQANLGPS
jgi:hypothetical protein